MKDKKMIRESEPTYDDPTPAQTDEYQDGYRAGFYAAIQCLNGVTISTDSTENTTAVTLNAGIILAVQYLINESLRN